MSLWFCMTLLQKMEKLNMGWIEGISFIMVFYISLIENGDAEHRVEKKNLPPYIYVCLFY